MPATTRKNTPRLRDGVMKRGTTWSYVIRVKDPETGISKPRWVGGFATEQDAKAARDQARVSARQGQYINRNSITVAAHLDQWLEAHAVEVKPKTLQDYRRRPARRAAQPPLAGHRPGSRRGPHHGLSRRHRRAAHRGNHQERPIPHRQHRPRHRAGAQRSPQARGRGAAASRPRVARH